MGAVPGGQGDGGVAVPPVQYVEALDVQASLLEPLRDPCKSAWFVGQPEDQGVVGSSAETGIGQGVEGPVGVVGSEGDDAPISGPFGVEGLDVNTASPKARATPAMTPGSSLAIMTILSMPLCPPSQAVVDKFVHHVPGDVGHGDDVGDVIQGGDLPLPEDLRPWPGEDHRYGVAVLPSRDAESLKRRTAYSAVSSIRSANSWNPLAPRLWRACQIEGREGAAGPRDGGIQDSDVLDGPGYPGDIVLSGQDYPAGDRGAYYLVAADGDAVDTGVEPVGLRIGNEWEHHAAQAASAWI